MHSQRYPTKEKASLEIYGKSGSLIVDLKDLSQTGACLHFSNEDLELNKGDLVRITIILKALNRRHNVSAEVMWVKENLSGVSFIPADQVLERLVQKNSDQH